MDKLKMHSINKVDENIAKIGAMFPNCLTERKNEDGEVEYAIDFDMLKQELFSVIVEGNEERYQFTWPDKKKSILLANAPIAKTLRPCREESVDFDTTENLYIEGDNLDVLKLLQETYLGKIKMIYIDPPYNTGNDFVYNDDFAEDADIYLANSGQFDTEGNRLVQNTESNGRFHTDWLNMIYARLKLAKDLLTDDGVIFISIDDNEITNIMRISAEIFGESNVLACFPRVTKKAGKTTDAIGKNHDYIVLCAKRNPQFYLPEHTDEGFKFSDEFEATRGKYKLNQTLDYDSLQYSASLDYPIEIDGKTLYPGQSYEKYLERKKGNHARADWAWRWSKELFDFGLKNGFIVVKHYDDYPTDEEEGKFKYHTQRILSCFKNGVCINPDQLVKSLRNRLRVISMAEEKQTRIDEILANIAEKDHFVVYCGDGKLFDDRGEELRHIQQVKRVLTAHGFKSSQFTASENMADRMDLVDAFNKGEISALAAIRCLDEGINIPSIKSALILSSNDDYREFVQRRGRILRKYNGKESANIYEVASVFCNK